MELLSLAFSLGVATLHVILEESAALDSSVRLLIALIFSTEDQLKYRCRQLQNNFVEILVWFKLRTLF
jgi:hypothetical protein